MLGVSGPVHTDREARPSQQTARAESSPSGLMTLNHCGFAEPTRKELYDWKQRCEDSWDSGGFLVGSRQYWTQRSALIPAGPRPLLIRQQLPSLHTASGAPVSASLNTAWRHKVTADVIERRQLWPFMCFTSFLALPPLVPLLQLAKNLPPRTIGYPWTLAFGTSKHGMSIKTLYRAMQGQDTPVLMVIKDSDGQVSTRQSAFSSKQRERERVTGRFHLLPGVRCAGLRTL